MEVITGDVIHPRIKKTLIFEPTEKNDAYKRMLTFVNWVKPISFHVRSGYYEDGSTVVELEYVFEE